MINGGLTSEEEEISNHIVSAWNKFIKLEQSHPSDISDFNKAIHDIQKILAMRVVRRDYPTFWITKESKK